MTRASAHLPQAGRPDSRPTPSTRIYSPSNRRLGPAPQSPIPGKLQNCSMRDRRTQCHCLLECARLLTAVSYFWFPRVDESMRRSRLWPPWPAVTSQGGKRRLPSIEQFHPSSQKRASSKTVLGVTSHNEPRVFPSPSPRPALWPPQPVVCTHASASVVPRFTCSCFTDAA